MASEPEISEISSMFERLERNRDISLFLPFLLGFANPVTRPDPQDQHQENENRPTSQDRIILVNPFTQGMVVIERTSGLDSLFAELSGKDGQPPASKASIEAMLSLEIKEEEGECVICLEEWGIGCSAKEMPCKHKFHGDCIEKWLGLHGSCPVCRYKMPVDEGKEGKKSEDEGRGRRGDGEIWVSYSFNSGRREESNQTVPSDFNDSNSREDEIDG